MTVITLVQAKRELRLTSPRHLRTVETLVDRLPNGIPVISHRDAKERCDQEVVDYVEMVEALIMRMAPQFRRMRFDNLSVVLKWFAVCEGSWRALETLYTFGKAALPGRPNDVKPEEEATALQFFQGDLNARAARERARIVAHLVNDLIRNSPEGQQIRIACIASGSARAVFTGVKMAGRKVKVKLLDNNRISLRYSANDLVSELGVDADITCVVGDVREIQQHFEADEEMDIVEAVGILDYLGDENAVRLLSQVTTRLVEGGTLIASNITDNPARVFLHSAVGWRDMHYRGIEEFTELFERAGFVPGDIKAHVTPTQEVYVIVEARRG